MKNTLYVTLLAAGLCAAAFAQDKPAGKKAPAKAGMPAMQKPAPEMKELRNFIGTWATDETMDPSPMMPQGGTATGLNTVRLGPGGFSVLMEQRSKSAMGPFTGHGVLSWDPNAKSYKMMWVDSMMPGMVVSTGKKEGETLVWTGEMFMDGKKMAVKDVISDVTPTTYTLTSFMNDGSGEKKTMTIKFTKQEPAAPAAKK
jgi:Protein of unknown function (DUF1579)